MSMARLQRIIAALALALASMGTLALERPVLTLHTNKGDIAIEMRPDKAPQTVANILQYARDGFYDGLIFHRVVRRFVIQTGGYDVDLEPRPTRDPIPSEARNGLDNEKWTVAMARTEDPDSADSQFFINLKLNMSLDARAGRDGYTVFGKVLEQSHHVVAAIGKMKTHEWAGFPNMPVETVVINTVSIRE